MKTLMQLCIIMALCLIGEIISNVIPFPMPSTIIAFLLLLVLLLAKVLKLENVADAGDLLLKHMAIFFIPAGTRIIEYLDIIKNVWIQFLFIIFLSTFVTFFTASYTVKAVIALNSKKKEV